MLVLKILVKVQTFRWRPFVPLHNFCHPTENQDSSLIQENLWYLKTFTFSFNQNAPLPFEPFLLNAWWMRTPFVVVCPKFSNKQVWSECWYWKVWRWPKFQVFTNADLIPLQIFSIGSEQPEKAVTKVWLCWDYTLTFVTFVYLFVIAPLTAFLTFVTTPFGNLASGRLKYLSLLILPFIFSPHFLRWCTDKQTL